MSQEFEPRPQQPVGGKRLALAAMVGIFLAALAELLVGVLR